MNQVVQIYRALSEEMRLRILMLLTHGELCVCDLMAIFNEPQSKISRHLAYLKNSGLVGSKRVGVWMHYFVKEPMDEIARAQIDFMRQHLSSHEWSQKDMAIMEEVKAQKLCEADEAEQFLRRTTGVVTKRINKVAWREDTRDG
jgi:ArsR family transcriptional regulator, arsenate/arsenite/antimonite-responsive transcriptional repressor